MTGLCVLGVLCYCSRQLALAVDWWFCHTRDAYHCCWVPTALSGLWPLSDWTG